MYYINNSTDSVAWHCSRDLANGRKVYKETFGDGTVMIKSGVCFWNRKYNNCTCMYIILSSGRNIIDSSERNIIDTVLVLKRT